MVSFFCSSAPQLTRNKKPIYIQCQGHHIRFFLTFEKLRHFVGIIPFSTTTTIFVTSYFFLKPSFGFFGSLLSKSVSVYKFFFFFSLSSVSIFCVSYTDNHIVFLEKVELLFLYSAMLCPIRHFCVYSSVFRLSIKLQTFF